MHVGFNHFGNGIVGEKNYKFDYKKRTADTKKANNVAGEKKMGDRNGKDLIFESHSQYLFKQDVQTPVIQHFLF